MGALALHGFDARRVPVGLLVEPENPRRAVSIRVRDRPDLLTRTRPGYYAR